MAKKSPHFGKLPALYNFFLNHYDDNRFAFCPKCRGKTEEKKVPLVIHVDPQYPVSLNYTCVYCVKCDLLIVHQDEIESYLTQMFLKLHPESIGQDYMVMGTFDRAYWEQGLKSPNDAGDLLNNLHGFKKYLNFGRGDEEPKIPAMFKKKEDKTQEIISMMKSHLPIAARVAPEWLPSFRNQGMPISAKQPVYIHAVFDSGKEAGIICHVTPSSTAPKKKTAFVISLTFLEVIGDTPLTKAMRHYQKERKAKLARS